MYQGIPSKSEIIYKGDGRIETYRRDAVMSGDPDAVVRPRDWQEVADILKWCNGNDVPITVCGARTSMTGSSVASEGILLTTDHFNKILDIGTHRGKGYAIVEPAVIARDFQRTVEEKGLHYPVVPTSCDNAFIGGTVSTNATGEDFYRYGPTRSFVREISYIMMDGTAGTLSREDRPPPSPVKGHGGYFIGGDEIDELIGSEGTLAVVSKITLELMPKVPEIFAVLIPFPTCLEALAFIDNINKGNLRPRSLEYIDTFALQLMRTHKACPKFSENVRALVYLKDETFEEGTDALMERWAEKISVALSRTPELVNETVIATTDKQKEELHELRHQIPQVISEMNEKLEKTGGGKLSGDWWVPKDKMFQTMQKAYAEAGTLDMEFTMYAHLGDGHPHTSFLCRTPEEKIKAKELIEFQSKRAVELGGGVAGEHGIGKIKRDLLALQYPNDIIAKMKHLKERFDPKWLLGKGNIFAGR